ncbi:MAG: response regulator [Oscillospiraceae bacterium]|nr:response regulator [Oscillospiraceae bacterium]MCL2279041.1 response regulator [Oscillospiraceae bacterium]
MTTNDTNKDIVLIVDDIDINRSILCEILRDDYQTIEADGGVKALDYLFDSDGNARKLLPTAVLLDVMMPDIDGFEVLERIKSHDDTKNIPVLIISASDSEQAESRGLFGGAADYITKPFNHDIVRARVDNHINLARYSHELEELVSIKTSEVTRTYESTLEVLATIIEYRNLESGAHIRRTTLLTEVLINKMLKTKKFRAALENENISSMIKASALHDIGKIGIPDSILLKPGKLTSEEFDVIKTHPTIGSRIIDSISENLPDNDLYLKYAKEICHFHHERWDGKGYPDGKKEDDIPLSARIVSVVDVYDALTSSRCYKEAFSHEVSLDILAQERGTQFDPNIIDLVPSVAEVFRKIVEENRDM